MDIKLRARLSAYSKLESISGINNTIPTPDETRIGSVLGVGEDGKYQFFGKVTTEQIDNEFGAMPEKVTTHDEIDTLFPEDPDVDAVTKEDIDSLFESDKGTDSATKDDIDKLFTPTDNKVGTVSYADIDSLFK